MYTYTLVTHCQAEGSPWITWTHQEEVTMNAWEFGPFQIPVREFGPFLPEWWHASLFEELEDFIDF